jgi:hypothetical protein
VKTIYLSLSLAAVAVASTNASAQTNDALDALKQQMQQMQKQMQLMQQKINQLEATKPSPRSAPMPSSEQTAPPPAAAQAPVAAEQPPSVPVTTTKSWTPSEPITLMRAGANYMNVSFDTLMDFGWSTKPNVNKVLELGDHDPSQRGFSLRNAEIALDGAVDPYLKGFGNIVFKLDNNNETEVELEEAYALTTSLPWNLQVKAGQFFTEFGRQNPQHPHTWAFVDEPLVMYRMFGGEGLRNVGARVSWLAPTPFYTELMLTVQNGEGGTAFSFRDPDNTYGRTPVDRGLRGPQDFVYVPRISSSFDLTDNETLVLGASAAFGPNDSGQTTRTEIYGLDAYWKWKSPKAHGGFPFVAWQTEAMYRHYQAGADPTASLHSEVLHDYGFYSQILYGFHLNWIVALRGEYVNNDQAPPDLNTPGARGDRTRISPNITWHPTEFSKLRLQYNYDQGQVFGHESSVWMQLEFLLGAHGAHKF